MADQELKRDEGEQQGAPLWMITYGDFMTLILTFFVLLFSMSEIDPTKAIKITNILRERTGDPARVMAPKTDVVQSFRVNLATQQPQAAETQSFRGTAAAVRSVDEGLELTIQERVMFDRGSYRLRTSSDREIRRSLDSIIQFLQGSRNKIEIRGYTSGEVGDRLELSNLTILRTSGSDVEVPVFTSANRMVNLRKAGDELDVLKLTEDGSDPLSNARIDRGERLLGYLRAENVARYLTRTVEIEGEEGEDEGRKEPLIRPSRIRISSGGSTNPRYRGKEKELLGLNRRVEIIVLEKGLN